MNFPTITIPDPAAVGAWLDQELGVVALPHRPQYGPSGWSCNHWHVSNDFFTATGNTVPELVGDIREQLARYDPLAKLRKEWLAAGCPKLELPTE